MSPLKRPKQEMPDFVAKALREQNLMNAYDARPDYQRNDYLMWINKALHTETKQKRLKIMLNELRDGTKYMNMDWHTKE